MQNKINMNLHEFEIQGKIACNEKKCKSTKMVNTEKGNKSKRYDKSAKNKIPRIPRKRFLGVYKKLRLQR